MTDQNLHDLRREADDRREAIAHDVELVTDRVAPGRIAERQKARVRRGLGDARDALFGTSDVRRKHADDQHSLRQRATDTVERAKDAAPDSVGEFTEGNPLAAGLIGLGVGLLAASLLPTSREEQHLVDNAQDTLDSAAAELAGSGKRAAESLKPTVEVAVEEVKASAYDSVDTVKDDAIGAAEGVKETATSAARDLRSDH